MRRAKVIALFTAVMLTVGRPAALAAEPEVGVFMGTGNSGATGGCDQATGHGWSSSSYLAPSWPSGGWWAFNAPGPVDLWNPPPGPEHAGYLQTAARGIGTLQLCGRIGPRPTDVIGGATSLTCPPGRDGYGRLRTFGSAVGALDKPIDLVQWSASAGATLVITGRTWTSTTPHTASGLFVALATLWGDQGFGLACVSTNFNLNGVFAVIE